MMTGEPVYSLETLFEQLGMSGKSADIENFILENRLDDATKLHEADIWTPQQAAFLQKGLENDASWAEVIDELNLRLHD
ncbi:MAG: DUF2789 family protein [Thiolinea sp.]